MEIPKQHGCLGASLRPLHSSNIDTSPKSLNSSRITSAFLNEGTRPREKFPKTPKSSVVNDDFAPVLVTPIKLVCLYQLKMSNCYIYIYIHSYMWCFFCAVLRTLQNLLLLVILLLCLAHDRRGALLRRLIRHYREPLLHLVLDRRTRFRLLHVLPREHRGQSSSATWGPLLIPPWVILRCRRSCYWRLLVEVVAISVELLCSLEARWFAERENRWAFPRSHKHLLPMVTLVVLLNLMRQLALVC